MIKLFLLILIFLTPCVFAQGVRANLIQGHNFQINDGYTYLSERAINREMQIHQFDGDLFGVPFEGFSGHQQFTHQNVRIFDDQNNRQFLDRRPRIFIDPNTQILADHNAKINAARNVNPRKNMMYLEIKSLSKNNILDKESFSRLMLKYPEFNEELLSLYKSLQDVSN